MIQRMNNYHYLVAGLPALGKDWKPAEGLDIDSIVKDIEGNCTEKDNSLINILLDGFDDEKLNHDFYVKALKCGNPFLQEYFRFDLMVRNAKVRYLNKALGRDSETDTIKRTENDSEMTDLEEFNESAAVNAALGTEDILGRERALDDIMWNKIDELTTFDYFDIEAVLGFIAKLHIIGRWLRLDDATGREMFRKLVDEVRGTFKGVEYDDEGDKVNN